MSRARRIARRVRGPLAIVLAALAVVNVASPAPAPVEAQSGTQGRPLLGPGDDRRALAAQGERVFQDTCSSCHGGDARGIPGRGPNLRGAGEEAADFYVRTNRMPLDDPEDQPHRRPHNQLTFQQKREVVAYVGTFGGPPIPPVDVTKGKLSDGQELFTDHCAGCHQVVARGGMVPKARIPDLQPSHPIDVAEAVDVGPYLMSNFTTLSDDQVNSISRYVAYTHDPEDRGGWGIGHIGPIPEGMVTWLLAIFALLLTIRIIGERTTQ